jgi:hypothetical protein
VYLRLNVSTVVLAAAGGLLVAALFFGGGSPVGSDDGALLPVALAALFASGAGLVAVLSGLAPRPRLDRAGLTFFGLLAGFVVWSGLSVWWSLAPDLSWNLFNRELVYLAFGAAGLYVGALVPNALRVVASGLALALGAVIAWALAGKVFPSLVAEGEHVARLRSPVGYWNALALLAAVAAVLGLWLASDAGRSRAARAAGGVLVYGAFVAVVLTYSRSGIVIVVLGVLAWLLAGRAAFETLATVALAAAAAAPVLVFAFLSPGITDDGQSYTVRVHDGALFAPVLLGAAAVVAGVAFVLAGRSGPPERVRRAVVRGTAAGLTIAACALLIVVVVRAGGPGPWIEARWHDFSSSKDVPSQQSDRIPSLSSNHRWTWWREAWSSFEEAPGVGRGAGTFPIVHRLERESPITVTQPHNLFLQALSDTGIVGFLLLAGAAVAGGFAAVRTVRRARGPERLAALALAIGAAAYLVQALVDVDWDFVATSGLLFFVVGVLAARGKTESRPAATWALGAGLGAAAAAASLLLPWLATHRTEDAYAAIERGAYSAAAGDARDAHSLNSLAVGPLFALGLAQSLGGHLDEAERTYARAVRAQPDNPETWYQLGQFELDIGSRKTACAFLTRAVALDRFDTTAKARRNEACRRP